MYSVASSLNSSFAVVSRLVQTHESVKPLHQPENYYQWQEYFKLLQKLLQKIINEKQNRDRDKNSTFTIIIIIAKIHQRKYYNRYYTAKGRKKISN